MRGIRIGFILLFAIGCHKGDPPIPPTKPPDAPRLVIDAKEAVRIAEQFVRENGYTDVVPKDVRNLEPESIEGSDDENDWLKYRHNTLRSTARGYRRGARNDPSGWTVAFEYVKSDPAKTDVGRAVTMDEHGEDVVVQHMDFFLRNLRPRPE